MIYKTLLLINAAQPQFCCMKPIGCHNYFVYILTNPGKTVLYTGVTNDLWIRIQQHYENRGKWATFAGRYYCYKLLYYEHYTDILMAIDREKEIKDLSREKKMELIKSTNPYLKFLAVEQEQKVVELFRYQSTGFLLKDKVCFLFSFSTPYLSFRRKLVEDFRKLKKHLSK